jgi:hypothetical protein
MPGTQRIGANNFAELPKEDAVDIPVKKSSSRSRSAVMPSASALSPPSYPGVQQSRSAS